MARGINRLSARFVTKTSKSGYHADGGGLYLQVTSSTAKSWVFRYTRHRRTREMGLGSTRAYGLAEARQHATDARRMLIEGLDPIEQRKVRQSSEVRLWGSAVADFIESQRPGWRSDTQAINWQQSLTDYGPAANLPVRDLNTAHVIKLLRDIWTIKTETATKVRSRIERVWSAEKVAGHVMGENPARWRGHLDALLPKPSKVAKVEHFKAMPYADVPAFMIRLRERNSPARLALRFTILTAARTNEVLGAVWGEFDLDAGLWTIPAQRMKAEREHVVPLVPEAIDILERLPKDKPPFDLSENAMLYLLQREPPRGLGQPYTVHGFRSTFRDWCSETTSTAHEVAEMALAHIIKNKAEAAYRRGHLLDKRRELMTIWAHYLEDEKPDRAG